MPGKRLVLTEGRVLAQPVDGRTRREHESPDAVLARGIEDVERAVDIGFDVQARLVGWTAARPHARRKVDNGVELRPSRTTRVNRFRVAQIDLVDHATCPRTAARLACLMAGA